jgi:DUF1009 family protein
MERGAKERVKKQQSHVCTCCVRRDSAALPHSLRPKGQGLFYKAAKPGQDRRVDLPTIGPATLQAVAAAGLAGLAFQAGSVICLDLPQMQAIAVETGLFLWAR